MRKTSEFDSRQTKPWWYDISYILGVHKVGNHSYPAYFLAAFLHLTCLLSAAHTSHPTTMKTSVPAFMRRFHPFCSLASGR